MKEHHDCGHYHVPVDQMKELLQTIQRLIYLLEKEHVVSHLAIKCQVCYAIARARKLVRGEE